jgi:signal transduction histidine kinase
LLVITLVTVMAALSAAYWWLSGRFSAELQRQLDTALTQQLDQVTARLDFTDSGDPVVDTRRLSDPRWERPYSGLYWQLDRLAVDGSRRVALLRSRSLWDAQLGPIRAAAPSEGLHAHDVDGPRGERLRVLERLIRIAGPSPAEWRLLVAGDTRDTAAALRDFDGVLMASLGGLGALLCLAALAQVGLGLAPLRALHASLQRLRTGATPRLAGRFPSEVQPLVDDLNTVLDHNVRMVERARTQAGDLAHGLKTPLAVIRNASAQAGESELAALVSEQVELAQQQIQWHLSRAQAAARGRVPGQRTLARPVVDRLIRVMKKIHADRALTMVVEATRADAAFAGEEQDLQEMLGNLIDNACASARSEVRIAIFHEGAMVGIRVEDDGPGIDPDQRAFVLRRGARLDESRPGSGLGLPIVVDLAELYGGALQLSTAATGGLAAALTLPAAMGGEG